MGKKVSKKGKGSYLTYKTNNQVIKNKIEKLERHCKKYPEDTMASTRLAELNKTRDYKPRAKPLVPGSNQTIPNPKPGFLHYPRPMTAGEQLRILLGIVKENNKPIKKPTIAYKTRKNVKP